MILMDEPTKNLLMILDSLNKNISEGKVLSYEFDSHLNERQLSLTGEHGPTIEELTTDVVLRITYVRNIDG